MMTTYLILCRLHHITSQNVYNEGTRESAAKEFLQNRAFKSICCSCSANNNVSPHVHSLLVFLAHWTRDLDIYVNLWWCIAINNNAGNGGSTTMMPVNFLSIHLLEFGIAAVVPTFISLLLALDGGIAFYKRNDGVLYLTTFVDGKMYISGAPDYSSHETPNLSHDLTFVTLWTLLVQGMSISVAVSTLVTLPDMSTIATICKLLSALWAIVYYFCRILLVHAAEYSGVTETKNNAAAAEIEEIHQN